MKMRNAFTIISLLIAVQVFPQMYILNEDFSGASGTTPPAGWNNVLITGTQDDKWHFDNPGDRILSYPITEPFAIFDSDSISENDEPEKVALETPLFDASTSNYILLYFVHVMDPGIGGVATIEAYDGDLWHEVFSYSTESLIPMAEIVDLSAITGGITNGRLRFIWSGNGSGFWAVDNIRIYASLPLDGGVVSIDSPYSPVVPGEQNVEITLGNFGYNTLSSAIIEWTADGVPQPSFSWMGSIGFGQTQSNIVIGTYNFQDPVLLNIWQTLPNGQADLNPYNDTVSEYLVAALCGTYTLGGSNPDFESFSQVAEVLNVAGINCPVEFIVRDGIYYEEFELRDIPGTSAINTITFRSESGDSTLAMIKIIPDALKYESMIYLNGTRHINFENLGFATGSQVSFANNAFLINEGSEIGINGCYFDIRNQFDVGIVIQGGSSGLEIGQNYFESISVRGMAINVINESTREIDILDNYFLGAIDWGYATIRIGNMTRKVNIKGNSLERCYRAIYLESVDSIFIQDNLINNSNDGIYVDSYCSSIDISGNRLSNIKSHQDVPDGTNGILVKNSSNTAIYNNFIHTTGSGPVMGISLRNATSCLASFNSVNVTNTDKKGESKGIFLAENNEVIAKNNIFRVLYAGTPVFLDGTISQLDFNKNNYYSTENTIGYYDGIFYFDLSEWINAVGMDGNSLTCIPFFTSQTDLSINQALLNNTGISIPGITTDIDGTPRNPANPDIGAKEYDKCTVDAGINAVLSPVNPLNGGIQEIVVQLQNQGTTILNGANINWSVNGELQTPFPWSGSLAENANTAVPIGNYDFQPGFLYTIKAWTSQPNNATDCNYYNDTISSHELAVPLCGNFTIGGDDPDFQTIDDAVKHLNLGGITCPVSFLIRDGLYYEQLVIKAIPGTSEVNTVTFRSESADSSRVTLKIIPEAQKFETMLYLDGTQNIIFQDLGLFTGTSLTYSNNAVLMTDAKNIRFEGCNFEVKKESDLGIGITEGCEGISVIHNRFVSLNPKALAIQASGELTRDINITGNNIQGATEWGSVTIRIGIDVQAVDISENRIENCYRAIYLVGSDSIAIKGNNIINCNDGIYIDNWCSNIEISGNRLTHIKSHQNATEGTSGILTNNSTQVLLFNNFIHTSGDGPVIAINLQNTNSGKVCFNSVNITNKDLQNKSKGLYLKTCSGISVRNNILRMKHSGTPVYISSTLAQIDLDYNNYNNYNQNIGYLNGNLYTDLPSWVIATNKDQHSFSVVPFFSTETDLSINQVLLNNSGSTVAEVAVDIDGNLRNPSTPDIGAKEYSPCMTDAGINTFTSPVPPLAGGTEEVRVVLQNQGTGLLSSVKINWTVNGEIQPQFSWSGSLAPSANTEVTTGNYAFEAGNAYILKAWTSSPNNSTDCNNKNDTISSRELSGPLCGTYTIGGSNPDFATFSQAAEVLNSAGITCPVTFLVRDGIYNEKFILREISGASSENTVTFQSENSDSSLAVINIDPEAVNYEPMILLNKSQFITFRNLGLFTGSTLAIANYAIQMDGAKKIGIEGCYLETRNESDFAIVIQGGSQDVVVAGNRFECIKSSSGGINITGAQTMDIEILDNEINGSTAWGNTLVKTGNDARKIKIYGNKINRSFRALYFIGADSLEISNNLIRNSNAGIYVDNLCADVIIENNQLINIQSIQSLPDGTSGIFALNVSRLDVINNFVQSGGIGPVLGINLQNVNACRTYFNSVNITNTDAQGKSRGIYFKAGDSIQGRDNIFNIKSSGIPIHLDQTITNLNLDYNNYFSPSGTVGKINSQVYTNLSVWGLDVNGDANSMVVNPYFKADTNPLPYQRILNGSGIPVPGYIYDIEGKLRHLQAPDIGCIEFFVDYGILELLSPDLNCFHPDVDSVIVYLRQFGDVPFDNLKVAYQLDDGDIHIDTIPGPLVYDFTHTFGTTETISTPGDYLFKVWLINTLDDNINNDTLFAKRYSKPAPQVSIEYDNICTGWEIHFTGHATVEEPYYVEKYEWLFGDGDTSDVQNPVHTYLAADTYEVILRAYSNAGCYSEESIPVTVFPDFQGLQLDYTLLNETCQDDGSGRLELFPSGGNPPYTIFLNGEQLESTLITNFSPGKYEIRVVDAQDCSRIDSIESVTLVVMNPQIIADPLTGFTPLTVDFDFTSDGATSWVWHFSETESDTNQVTSHTFTEYGNHEVILGVNSGPPYYCTETTTINIFVDIIITIEANSVFTPNEDGYNDYFEVKSVGLKDMLVKIFNQWGNKVYEISEVDGKWDGNTTGGAEAPDGTYFYSLVATGVNDLVYERKGSVLLLRHGAAAFPNPVTDHVNIKPYETLQPPVIISVYSVFGQLSHSEIIEDPGNINIDLSNLPGGIYMLKASDGSRDCYVRIIKN
jgi:gliding motility-associated-like protein